MEKLKVAVNGYGVAGKRVADAVMLQPDMELVGVCDMTTDWRMKVANAKGIPVYAYNFDAHKKMQAAGIETIGILNYLLKQVDIVVDCAPKKIRPQNTERYRESGITFIVQGSEKHEMTGHFSVAEASCETAPGKSATRVVSCNITSIARTLTALKKAGQLKNAHVTLHLQTTAAGESRQNGIINTLVSERDMLSPESHDAQRVDAELDAIIAAKIPERLDYSVVRLSHPASGIEMPGTFHHLREREINKLPVMVK